MTFQQADRVELLNASGPYHDNNAEFLRQYLNNSKALKKTLEDTKYCLSYSQFPIAFDLFAQNSIGSDNVPNNLLHVRKESYELNEGHHNFRYIKKNKGTLAPGKNILFIDCIDDHYQQLKYTERLYVPWAALTFYSRNVEPEELLKPLNQIYPPEKKTKFCDFLYKNVGQTGISSAHHHPVLRPLKELKELVLRSSDAYLGTTYRPRNNYEDGSRKRFKFYQLLSDRKPVEFPKGKKRESASLFDEAVELHQPYRFNVAFENSIVKGWVTEKIVNAFLAGCIPIYRGHNSVFDFFNRKSFIYADDFASLEELADYVMKVENTPSLYEQYLQEPPCHQEGLDRLLEYY